MSLLRSSFLGEKGFKMSFFVLKVRTQLFSHLEWLEFSQLTISFVFAFYKKNLVDNMLSAQFNKKKKKTRSGSFS
jgi:hypothetical protein